MEAIKRIIEEYIFRERLEGLKDVKAQVKVDIRINRVRLGNFGDTKGISQGVHELRIHFGPGYRVYYGLDGPKIVLLLCGGDKGSQKKDIKKAVALLKEYEGEK